jgi:hypothetical protein
LFRVGIICTALLKGIPIDDYHRTGPGERNQAAILERCDADAIVKWAELHAFLHVHHWILPKAISEVGEQKIEFKISHQKFIAARPG